jgi:hypothetical protein
MPKDWGPAVQEATAGRRQLEETATESLYNTIMVIIFILT